MPRKKVDDSTVTFSSRDGGDPVTVTAGQLDRLAAGMDINKMRGVAVPLDEPEKLPVIQVTKIKISGNDSSLLRYDRVTENQETEHCELAFFGAVHPDFQDAMDNFRHIAIDVLGLDESAWGDAVVSGISLKHESSLVGLTITMQRKLEDAGLTAVVNTPYLNPDFLAGEANRINKLAKEAIACLNGKRAQMDLFSANHE